MNRKNGVSWLRNTSLQLVMSFTISLGRSCSLDVIPRDLSEFNKKHTPSALVVTICALQ